MKDKPKGNKNCMIVHNGNVDFIGTKAECLDYNIGHHSAEQTNLHLITVEQVQEVIMSKKVTMSKPTDLAIMIRRDC